MGGEKWGGVNWIKSGCRGEWVVDVTGGVFKNRTDEGWAQGGSSVPLDLDLEGFISGLTLWQGRVPRDLTGETGTVGPGRRRGTRPSQDRVDLRNVDDQGARTPEGNGERVR